MMDVIMGMTETENAAVGIWTIVAILAGLSMIIRAAGDTYSDIAVALASGVLLLIALLSLADATRNR
jgi:hypothetical protein